MSLRDDIQKIVSDTSISYEEKGRRLALLVTKREVSVLLKKESESIKLKEPLQPRKENMRVLPLSIYNIYFDAIRKGSKKIEYRDYKDYYIQKCTYVEDGKRYLVPYDAITFYVGRGDRARSMTVALTNITCDGQYIMFHLGEILYPKKPE